MRFVPAPGDRVELVLEDAFIERHILWCGAIRLLGKDALSGGSFLNKTERYAVQNLCDAVETDNDVTDPKLYPTTEHLKLIARGLRGLNQQEFRDFDMFVHVNTMITQCQDELTEGIVTQALSTLDDDLSNL
jgi:hypothetical protein